MVALEKKKRKERADDGGAAVVLHLFSFCWVEDRLGPVGGKEDCLEKQTKKQNRKKKEAWRRSIAVCFTGNGVELSCIKQKTKKKQDEARGKKR